VIGAETGRCRTTLQNFEQVNLGSNTAGQTTTAIHVLYAAALKSTQGERIVISDRNIKLMMKNKGSKKGFSKRCYRTIFASPKNSF